MRHLIFEICDRSFFTRAAERASIPRGGGDAIKRPGGGELGGEGPALAMALERASGGEAEVCTLWVSLTSRELPVPACSPRRGGLEVLARGVIGRALAGRLPFVSPDWFLPDAWFLPEPLAIVDFPAGPLPGIPDFGLGMGACPHAKQSRR